MSIPRLITLFLTLVLIGSGCQGSGPRRQERPNVLFISVDDLRPTFGAYENKHIKTPHMDRLAQSGVTFRQAYAQQAVCNPSRASLMTGLRPDSIRVWDLGTDFRVSMPNVITLPQYFKQHGYHAVVIGKLYHNIFPDSLSWSEPKMFISGYPFDPDAVYRHPENIAIQEVRKAEIMKAGQQDRYIDQFGEWYLKANATEIVDMPDNVYYDGAQTDWALEKLTKLETQNQPFFFAIGYYRPHLPFNAPKKYWDIYDRDAIPMADNRFLPANAPKMAINNMRELRGYADFKHAPHPFDGSLSGDEARLLKHGYYASVSYIDAQIGRLLDKLEQLGLSENTIVVLWGDHGWKLGEHNSWAKMTNYKIDTHSPLIIRAPGRIPENLHLDQMVEFVDIYPTLAELADLPIPDYLQGISAMPLFEHPDRVWKKAVFTQFLREGIWMAPDGIEYMGYSLRTDKYNYVAWMKWKTKEYVAYELYDQQADPGENVNLADKPEYASIITDLEAQRRAGWRGALPPGASD